MAQSPTLGPPQQGRARSDYPPQAGSEAGTRATRYAAGLGASDAHAVHPLQQPLALLEVPCLDHGAPAIPTSSVPAEGSVPAAGVPPTGSVPPTGDAKGNVATQGGLAQARGLAPEAGAARKLLGSVLMVGVRSPSRCGTPAAPGSRPVLGLSPTGA